MPMRNTSPAASPTAREALVHAAVEELRALGHLVVDLEHRRDAEQDEEAEVDARVHDARGGVAEQRLHVHAGTEVAEAPSDVLARRRATVGRAALVVAHPLPEQHSRADDQQRGDDVEREPQRARDATEHLARHDRVVVELEHDAGDARDDRDQREADPDREHDVRRAEAARHRSHGRGSLGRGSFGGGRSHHAQPNAAARWLPSLAVRRDQP